MSERSSSPCLSIGDSDDIADTLKILRNKACQLHGYSLQELEDVKEHQDVTPPATNRLPQLTDPIPEVLLQLRTHCDYQSVQNVESVEDAFENWKSAIDHHQQITKENKNTFEEGCEPLLATQKRVEKKRDEMHQIEEQVKEQATQQMVETKYCEEKRLSKRDQTVEDRDRGNQELRELSDKMQETVNDIDNTISNNDRLKRELAKGEEHLRSMTVSLKDQIKNYENTQKEHQSILESNIAVEEEADSKLNKRKEKLSATLQGQITITSCREAADKFLSDEVNPKIEEAGNALATTQSATNRAVYEHHSQCFVKMGSFDGADMKYRIYSFLCCPIFSDLTENEVTLTPVGSHVGQRYRFKYVIATTFTITDQNGDLLSGNEKWKVTAVEGEEGIIKLTSGKTEFSVNDQTTFLLTGALPVSPLRLHVVIMPPKSKERKEYFLTHVGQSLFTIWEGLKTKEFNGREKWVVKPAETGLCQTFNFINPEDDTVLVENGGTDFIVTAVPNFN
eukprot:TRINITY_DN34724_c0_g1_i1.p1 TRINITY_DN34724_c0_g1~~TRINITY_DN34724_c0_g1_i1.p1  ORF type:complete len:528 (+),score=108.25 TRINITY_DN34724_c0_g1_i1:63-1586(+)